MRIEIKQKSHNVTLKNACNNIDIAGISVFMEKYDLELIKSSVVGFNTTKSYPTAVKEVEVKDLNDILKHRKDFPERFNEKGRLRSDVLVGELFLLAGKDNINLYRRGQRLAYLEQFEAWKEFGFDSEEDFYAHLPFKAEAIRRSKFVAVHFDEKTCIELGSKLELLPAYLLEELSEKELTKILADIKGLSYRDAREYIQEYKEPERYTRKRLPDSEAIQSTIELQKQEDGKYKEYTINIRPRFKVEDNGKKLVWDWPNRAVGELGTIAVRQLEQRILDMIGRRIQDLLTKEEYQNYAKKILKNK